MPIYVAKNYDGRVVSVVLAKSYELAQAYWQGQGLFPHSVDQWTEKALEDHPTGVLPILKTMVKTIHPYDISRTTEILVVDK